MRNLTIKRNKSFVGCLAKMKVYIADPAGNIMLNHTPCRKIGDLKNGEEKIFSIDENETTIFVIADQLSKDFCNEFCKIPAGGNDVFLSGKNCFNPANGNAFRFDGVADEEILQNRKKGTRKGMIILIAAAIIGVVAGVMTSLPLFFNNGSEPLVFSAEEMQITLTDAFTEATIDGFTACYDSKDVAVLALKESFSMSEDFEDYTLEEYGQLVLQNNGLESYAELQNHSGLTYFEYQNYNPETEEEYYYFSVVYKSTDAI